MENDSYRQGYVLRYIFLITSVAAFDNVLYISGLISDQWAYDDCFIQGLMMENDSYRQVSNIRRTKSQHLKDSRTVLWLSLPIPLKPDV